MKRLLLAFALCAALLSACVNPLTKKAYSEHQQWLEGNPYTSVLDSIDNSRHLYNQTHDTTLLINALATLEASLWDAESQRAAYAWRKLSINRQLHRYDSARGMLSTYPNSCFSPFGKKQQELVTDICEYNYTMQTEERDLKVNELITYMEYCFEHEDSIAHGAEAGFLKKYSGNQLALESVPTPVDFSSLSWYVRARALRGDDLQELQKLIEVLARDYHLSSMAEEWMPKLLELERDEIDFDKYIE